ncbi:MAG: DMT family transporter [Gemmatimonadetes bacterium]|nr:DMT family transporter [Gemmatimonadota bacterium]
MPRVPGRRLLETGVGARTAAFGVKEWGILGAIALIWGSSFLLMEIGLRAFQPTVIATARIGLGAAALALIPAARRPVDREDLPRVILLGLTYMGIPLMLFPIAQQWIDSSVAGMLNAGMPLTTAAWAAALLRRLPGRNQAIGLLVGFGGIVAISWPELHGSEATALGTALIVIAVVMYGLATNIAVPLQQRYGALPVLLRSQLAALAVVAPFGLAGLEASTWKWESALAILPLGVLGTGLAFVLMVTLAGRVGGPRSSVTSYFTPLVAIALGVVVLGEEVGLPALVGTALILVGAWLATRRET